MLSTRACLFASLLAVTGCSPMPMPAPVKPADTGLSQASSSGEEIALIAIGAAVVVVVGAIVVHHVLAAPPDDPRQCDDNATLVHHQCVCNAGFTGDGLFCGKDQAGSAAAPASGSDATPAPAPPAP